MRRMRWDCNKKGCFNKLKRLKLGVFDECFSGKNGMTDVDGFIERYGRFLFMEWKGGSYIASGQRIAFKALVKHKAFTIFVIHGFETDMSVYELKRYENGVEHDWEDCDLPRLKSLMEEWEKND